MLCDETSVQRAANRALHNLEVQLCALGDGSDFDLSEKEVKFVVLTICSILLLSIPVCWNDSLALRVWLSEYPLPSSSSFALASPFFSFNKHLNQ